MFCNLKAVLIQLVFEYLLVSLQLRPISGGTLKCEKKISLD